MQNDNIASKEGRISILIQAMSARDQVCEALGCEEKSTRKIFIPIGEDETIFLFVCDACIRKFRVTVIDPTRIRKTIQRKSCSQMPNDNK